MPETQVTPLATFAAEVRPHRQARGWSQTALGDKIGYSGSFVSDVERCERQPALDFALGCDREFGTPETFVRLHKLIRHNAYPSWFSPVVPLERKATRIHAWEPFVIPGLLQTAGLSRPDPANTEGTPP
jgi:transcriptional regulator with XRE-family HTH domain